MLIKVEQSGSHFSPNIVLIFPLPRRTVVGGCPIVASYDMLCDNVIVPIGQCTSFKFRIVFPYYWKLALLMRYMSTINYVPGVGNRRPYGRMRPFSSKCAAICGFVNKYIVLTSTYVRHDVLMLYHCASN